MKVSIPIAYFIPELRPLSGHQLLIVCKHSHPHGYNWFLIHYLMFVGLLALCILEALLVPTWDNGTIWSWLARAIILMAPVAVAILQFHLLFHGRRKKLQEFLRNNQSYFWISLLFTSFISAGLCEELWRSAFICALKTMWPEDFGSRIGRIVAVTLAALIFGLGHTMQGPLVVLQAGAIGFGLGLIMVLHRSIWPAVIAHGSVDATTMLAITIAP